MSIDEGRLDKVLKGLSDQDSELGQTIAALAAIVIQIPGVENTDTNLALNTANMISGGRTTDRSRLLIRDVVEIAKGLARERAKT